MDNVVSLRPAMMWHIPAVIGNLAIKMPESFAAFVTPVSNIAALMTLRDTAAANEADAAPHRTSKLGAGSAIVDRANLAMAIAALVRIVERKNTIPILSNVRLTGRRGGILLTATNLDMVATKMASGTSEGFLDITVPAHVLADIVKKAKAADTVNIIYDGGTHAAFKFADLSINLQTMPATDFPEMANVKFSHSFTMETSQLHDALAATQSAISTEETRYYLNGVYMEQPEPWQIDPLRGIRFTATDGHRLVSFDTPYVDGCQKMPGVIIPRAIVGEVLRHVKAKSAPDSVKIDVSDVRIRFDIDGLVFTSKVVDGTFPDYQRVIPKMNSKLLTVGRKELRAAVEQCSIISSERGRAVKLAIEDSKVTCSVNNPDAGTATMSIAGSFQNTETLTAAGPLDIGFNSYYVIGMLDLMDGEEVTLALADPGSPTIFTDAAEPRFTAVLMPMRV